MVDRADSLLVIEGVDTDDYVHFGRALVDHADVDVVVGESGEDGGGCAVAGRHVVPDGGDEGKPAVDVDAVGTERVAELVNELLCVAAEAFVAYDEGESVDAGGHVLE